MAATAGLPSRGMRSERSKICGAECIFGAIKKIAVLRPMAQNSLMYRGNRAGSRDERTSDSQRAASPCSFHPRRLKSWGSARLSKLSSRERSVRYSRARDWLRGENPTESISFCSLSV